MPPASPVRGATRRCGLVPARRRVPARHRFEWIDLLRIGAAGAVLGFHYAFRGAAANGFTEFQIPGLIPVAKYGYLGVELFFVISGFVIALSAEGRSATAFAGARFLRIYPGFVAAMTITALLAAAIGRPSMPSSLLDWLANSTLFPTLFGRPFVDGVYWTLELEVVFYAWVAVFLVLGWFGRHRMAIIIVWLALSLAVDVLTTSKIVHGLLVTDAAPFFAGGMLIHDIRRRGATADRVVIFAVAVAMSIESVLMRAADYRNELQANLDDGVLIAIVPGLYAIFLFAISLPGPGRAAARWMAFAGAVSYPLYLLHENIGFMLFNMLGDALPVAATAALVVGTVGAGTIAFTVWVEPVARRAAAHLLRTLPPPRRLCAAWRGAFTKARLPARGQH